MSFTARHAFVLPEEGCDLEEIEMDLIDQALDGGGGNVGRAARLVGLTAKTLEGRMQRLGL